MGNRAEIMAVSLVEDGWYTRNVTVVPAGLVRVIGYYHGEVCPPLADTGIHTWPC